MTPIKVKQATVKSLEIEGDLTFSTINKNTSKIMDKLLTPHDISIDLKKVKAVDSAGLALIIEWLKTAHSRGINLNFINVPKQLLALARLSGFEYLFQSNDKQLNIKTDHG